MALIFEVEADCVSEEAAKRFGRHFVGLSFSLPDGRLIRVTESDTRVFTDSDGNARCCIVSIAASFTGTQQVLETDDERRDYILFLYDHLRKAPPFRFAVAGLECHDFSLCDRVGRLSQIEGLVICDKVFVDAGSPAAFQPFAPGYFWIPFTKSTRIL